MAIDQAVWDSHKAQIYDLYYHRQHSIEEVIRVMTLKGFTAK